jgi:hypothetical protein
MRRLLFSFSMLFTGMLLFSHIKAQSITPEDSSGYYYFKVANVYFEVDPSFGSRISSLKINGNETMYIDRTYGGGYLWGATLWQSPQSEWNWPPSEALDQDPYSGGIFGDSITLLSDEDNRYNTHLKFRKTFRANLSDTSITVKYTMINTGTTAHSYSAWQLVRVPSGGMALFPYGEGDITGAFASEVAKVNNVAWFKYDGTETPGQKFFSDGSEGWYAFLDSSKRIFMQKFMDVAADKQAPGENEIELWFNSHDSYIELETQSEYTNIAAGDSLVWIVKWYLRNLPATISDTVGSLDLISYVRDIMKEQVIIPSSNREIYSDPYMVYPNPVVDKLTVESQSELDNDAYLNIYNMQGQTVLNKKLLSKRSIIGLSSLANGVYIYEIHRTKFDNQRGKLIIKR